MAVDAHRLHHRLQAAGHHQPAAAAAAVAAHWQQANNRAGAAAGTIDAPPLFQPGHACYGGEVAGGAASQSQGYGYHQSCVCLVAPPASAALAGADQYSQLLTLPQRGPDTFDSTAVTHKRKRAEHSPVLDAAVLASQAHRQRMEIDRLVLNHTTKIWTGLAEQTRRYMRLIAEAVEAKAAKRLRDKDEEIERVKSINWALEERLKAVCGEAQVWRDIAQSSEAAANTLRGELEQALNMQTDGADGAADDAESCCYGENEVALREDKEIGTLLKQHGTSSDRRCKGCGDGVAEVLLLPCRHLCTCVSCATTVRVCPVCGCAKNGTVSVNFS